MSKDDPPDPPRLSEEEVERLYLEPRQRFVPARDALAARLRKEGDREAAAAVKALRKPTAAAWLVNQVSLRTPDRIDALVRAAERLEAAQRRVLAGEGREELRKAMAERREALDAAIRAAREIAAEADEKVSDTTFDRLTETLESTLVDPDVRDRVRSGRLEREARGVSLPVGLGETAARPTGDASAERRRRQTRRSELRRELKGAERELRSAERELRGREREAEAAQRRLEEVRESVEVARDRADRLRGELDELDQP